MIGRGDLDPRKSLRHLAPSRRPAERLRDDRRGADRPPAEHRPAAGDAARLLRPPRDQRRRSAQLMIGQLWFRLIFVDLGPPRMVPTLWIVLGIPRPVGHRGRAPRPPRRRTAAGSLRRRAWKRSASSTGCRSGASRWPGWRSPRSSRCAPPAAACPSRSPGGASPSRSAPSSPAPPKWRRRPSQELAWLAVCVFALLLVAWGAAFLDSCAEAWTGRGLPAGPERLTAATSSRRWW